MAPLIRQPAPSRIAFVRTAFGGLRHGNRQDDLAGDDLRHQPRPKHRTAQLVDIWRHEIAVQMNIEGDVAPTHALLDNDLVKTQVIYAGATELGISPKAQ